MPKGGKPTPGTDTPLDLIGTAGDDRLSGGSLDDRFTGRGGNDQIKGGGGTDTAVFSGDIQGYSITAGKRGAIIVTDIDPTDGDDGTDTLYSVEALEFANYTYSTVSENTTPLVTYSDTLTVNENGTTTFTFSVTAMNGGDPRGYITNADVSYTFLDGSLSADGATRTLTYEIGSGWGSAVESLAEGETALRSFDIVGGTLYGGYVWRDTVTVTLVGVNDAPTVADGTLIVEEDGGPRTLDLSTLGNDIDSDDDGATLSYRIVDAPQGLSAWVDGTDLVVDPGAGFQDLERTDSAFVTLTIEAVDAHGAVSGTATVTVEVQGQNDPLPDYLNPDGSVDYAALGLTVPTTLLAKFDGFEPTPELLDWVKGTPGDDFRIIKATHIGSLDDNTFFGYADTTVGLGGGDDRLAFVLEGQNASIGGFSGVHANTGDGDDVIVLDATGATDSFYMNVTDFRTGDGSDQVLIDLTTEANGWIDDFRYGLRIDTGNDNDLVSFRRVDSDGGAEARTYTTIDTGSGDDEVDILYSVQNVTDGRFVGTVSTGYGNDIARIDTSGTTGSGAGAKTGFYGNIQMGLGDDVLYLDLADPVEDDAFAYIGAGAGGYADSYHDVLYLEMANVADITVTEIGLGNGWRYLLEWNGQTLDVDGWDEIYAADGLLI